MTNKPETLAAVILHNAEQAPDQIGFHTLADDLSVETSLSYGELLSSATHIAEYLIGRTKPGERVALMYDNSLEFVSAFAACLIAGRIAVPVYPPLSRSSAERLVHVIEDSGAEILLTHKAVTKTLKKLKIIGFLGKVPGLSRLVTTKVDAGAVSSFLGRFEVVETDDFPKSAHAIPLPTIKPEDIAFLQYTSGSTSEPKGVVITHENLMTNEAIIQQAMQLSASSCVMSWLPVGHDMGLIGMILQPLYTRFPMYLMTPLQFVKHPLKWLQAVSRYGVDTTGAPNFAYELCIKAAERTEPPADIDLSSLRVLYNGAEPIHKETLDRFADAFSPYGLHPSTYFPCYGLAEATLFVSGKIAIDQPVQTLQVNEELYRENRIQVAIEGGITLVSSGQVLPDTELAIIDPESQRRCTDDKIGEIVVRGKSVTPGIWQRPELGAELFVDLEGKRYLHTGDTGFVHEGNLYVTGRIKDLIIILGKNFYPHDIEKVATEVSPLCRRGNAIAFSVEGDHSEALVLVMEVHTKDPVELTALAKEIRAAIMRSFQLGVSDIQFVEPRTLPKTTSGKLQRRLCRQQYLQRPDLAR